MKLTWIGRLTVVNVFISRGLMTHEPIYMHELESLEATRRATMLEF